MSQELEQVLQTYDQWLERQPFSLHTRRAYHAQIHHYAIYLAERLSKVMLPSLTLMCVIMLFVITKPGIERSKSHSLKKLWLSVFNSSRISTRY